MMCAIPQPVISVVLPCFNAAPTILAAIESIRNQTFTDWELILVDDGSTDASRAIAQNAAQADPRVRVVCSAHEGIVRALQRACAEARGEFIARMDADDVAHPERLAKQFDLMRGDPAVALCGTQVRMTGTRIGLGRRRYEAWVNGLTTHEAMVRELFVECPIPHPTFLIRTEALAAVGGYQDHGWAEDYDLCMRLHFAGGRFGKVPEPLLDWTESASRLSMTDLRYSPASFRALKRHYLFLHVLQPDQAFYQWGAGEVGKRWLREWGDRKPLAVVDVDPRKNGRTIHGVSVIAPEQLPELGPAFLTIAVGARNAREEIRCWLRPRGFVELRDFLFLA